MSRKLALLFLIVFLFGLFLPLVSLAGTYDGIKCSTEYEYNFQQKKCCREDGTCVKPTEKGVCYDGLVPCGKKVCVGAFNEDTCKNLLKDAQDKVKAGLSPTEAFEQVCGVSRIEDSTCQFCHFFVMIDGIFDFILIYVVPPIAVLMLVIGGIMFYFAGGKPELVKRGTSLIKNVIIGLFLVYGAFMLVGTVLKIIGVAEWTELQNFTTNFIFTIDCEITL